MVVYDQSTRDVTGLAADSFLSILLGKLDSCFHSVSILTGRSPGLLLHVALVPLVWSYRLQSCGHACPSAPTFLAPGGCGGRGWSCTWTEEALATLALLGPSHAFVLCSFQLPAAAPSSQG